MSSSAPLFTCGDTTTCIIHQLDVASPSCRSSGTGFAGIFGYSWVIGFTVFLGASFQLATLCALVLPLCFVLNFQLLITDPHIARDRALTAAGTGEGGAGPQGQVLARSANKASSDAGSVGGDDSASDSTGDSNDVELLLRCPPSAAVGSGSSSAAGGGVGGYGTGIAQDLREADLREDLSLAAGRMTAGERARSTLTLWPFMIPLFVVYFAEYAMQSGAWAAMGACAATSSASRAAQRLILLLKYPSAGFPVDSENARDLFYEYRCAR